VLAEMPDPLSLLASRFEDALRSAFGEEHAKTDPALKRSQHADFQADVALGLARKVKKSPREVAAAILEKLDTTDLKVEIAGPGFLNITVSDAWLATAVAEMAADPRLGLSKPKREKVIIDYSAPNVAKEMHVGNLRSSIIGDALARVLEELGHEVVRQNHIGDWGPQFGMLIERLIERGDTSKDLTIGDLNALYQEARERFDADAAFADRSRKRVVLLQAGDAETLALWRRFVDASLKYMASVYAKLGITLDDRHVVGESAYNPLLDGVVKELEEKKLLVESDGALCVFPPGFVGKEGTPLPLIVRKQDGGYGYATTDLAAIRERTQTHRASRILYVVGAPQQQHFAMVFATAREAGWLKEPVVATHVAFGSVLDENKKMFRTRKGKAVRLMELLDEGIERAAKAVAEKNPDLDEATRAEVARMVGIGSIKYADLSSDRVKDYVFDFDKMLAFEGNTAPYLQYAHARIRSILRSAKDPEGTVAIVEKAERELALELLGFGRAVDQVVEGMQPHKLCTYLFDLAMRFTGFYEKCHVLRAEDEGTRRSRLALCHVTASTLARGLGLLGIEAPERM
jgi:arginyl-tRNA synthetase